MASARIPSRGYSVSFVEKPPDDLQTECLICFDTLSQPKRVSCCGTKFCPACIGFIETKKSRCPHCRARVFTSDYDKEHKRKINSYKVHCPNKEKGCEWTGGLSECDAHINGGLAPPESEATAVVVIERGCPFQELDCDRCKAQFERRLMLDHITHRCPYRDVECKYRALGCSVGKRPLKEMKEHKRKSMESHLSLTARGIFTTKRELQSELTQQGERQQEQNYHYDQQLRHQQEQLTDLQNKMQSQVRRLERKYHLAFGSLLLAVLVLTIIVLYTAAVQIQNQNDEYPTPLTSEVKSCTEEEHVASAYDISSTTKSGGSRMKEVCTWTLNCDEVDSHDRLELPSDNASVNKTPSQKLFERESQTNNKVEDETNNSESDSVDLPVEMAVTAWDKVSDLSSMNMSHMDLDNNTSNMCLVDTDPADSELMADFGGAIASYHIEEPNTLERGSLEREINSKDSQVCIVKDIYIDIDMERCCHICEALHNQSRNLSYISEVQDSETIHEIDSDVTDSHIVNDSQEEGEMHISNVDLMKDTHMSKTSRADSNHSNQEKSIHHTAKVEASRTTDVTVYVSTEKEQSHTKRDLHDRKVTTIQTDQKKDIDAHKGVKCHTNVETGQCSNVIRRFFIDLFILYFVLPYQTLVEYLNFIRPYLVSVMYWYLVFVVLIMFLDELHVLLSRQGTHSRIRRRYRRRRHGVRVH